MERFDLKSLDIILLKVNPKPRPDSYISSLSSHHSPLYHLSLCATATCLPRRLVSLYKLPESLVLSFLSHTTFISDWLLFIAKWHYIVWIYKVCPFTGWRTFGLYLVWVIRNKDTIHWMEYVFKPGICAMQLLRFICKFSIHYQDTRQMHNQGLLKVWTV